MTSSASSDAAAGASAGVRGHRVCRREVGCICSGCASIPSLHADGGCFSLLTNADTAENSLQQTHAH